MLCQNAIRHDPKLMTMNSPMITLFGLALLFAAPAAAQESKEASSEKVVETQETTAGEITQASGEGVGKTAEDVSTDAKSKGKSKLTPEQRKCAREVAKEMGKYHERQAQLRRAHKLGKEKNNQELLDKVAELRPKLEADHAKEMKRLNETYGKETVAAANEAINNAKNRDGARADKMREKGADKAKSENERATDKGRKAGKKRKVDKSSGDNKGKGKGDPHEDGAKGDPHKEGEKGDPHDDASSNS